ncbi:MAG: DUF2934 domain-containing protein [Candidatus Omnitrophota bacterium]
MAVKKSTPAAKAVSAVSAVREMSKPVEVKAAVVKKAVSDDQLFNLTREKAYELYIKRGCSAGDSLKDWYKAEELVKKELGL